MTTTLRSPRRRRFFTALGTAAALPVLGPLAARGQGAFPSRPITLVVPFAPGGIADVTARAVAEQMQRTLGQPVVVDNRPGAGGIVASQAVATAKPDGHTLLVMSNGHAVSVGLFKKLPYDPVNDFAPISTLGSFDLGLFTAANGRFASAADAIAYGRANPGKLNIGTIAVGSTQHLAAKLLESVGRFEAVVVPYKGSPAVVTALRAGEIDLALEIVGPMLPQVTSGAVRMLAVSSSQRHPKLPQVPTLQQAGLAGYDVTSWNALAAPAGTPPDVIATLQRAAAAAVASPAVQQRLGDLGVRLAASTPAELQAHLKREIARWGQVIKAAGIEPE